tara:strand:- start:194 stop:529 length:336 start_codon:yes stop_codon:yes gene_type:complete
MPLLNISTSKNVKDKYKLLENSSKFISKLLNKSEDYVMVKLLDSLPLFFAGTDEPSCFIEIKSIGSMEPTKISKQLCEFFSLEIGLPPERIYISFQDVDPAMWAWNNKTFG